MLSLQDYAGREQSFLKHTILETYLERLFMIIGRTEVVINYVDCFAGPWADDNKELKDTSIGLSINLMKKCVATLRKNFNKSVTFRALYIEKDKQAFARLQDYISKLRDPSVQVESRQGDYTTLIPDIMAWSQAHFTFFFVDPKGWKGIIGPTTMKALLERPKTEFLINLMYDFANRAASIEKHEADMIELLGEPLAFKGNETADERRDQFLGLYRKNIKSVYGGRSAYVSIRRPGTTKLLYFLVYLTRHPLGIKVFMEAAEKMEMAQRVTYAEVLLRKQFEAAPILDLFAEHDTDQCVAEAEDNRHLASRFLLTRLSTEPLLIDYECWASFLEESNLYPTDLQLAMKELIDDDQVKNMNADVSRRRSQFIQPRYANESERWCLSTDKSKKRDT